MLQYPTGIHLGLLDASPVIGSRTVGVKGAAEAGQAVVGGQIELGLRGVDLGPQVDVADLEVVDGLLQVGALPERARDRGVAR